jgi:hypothetical protein
MFTAKMSLVVCDTSAKVQLLLDEADKLDSLKTIVVMDKMSEKNIADAKTHGIKLISFQTVMVCMPLSYKVYPHFHISS